ncbi:MAG TPA: hypothetical protein VNJ03_02920 [Vicinamibacterales bacterium]|nr:hypothetical protein [Vicinamibacterales bacterium]
MKPVSPGRWPLACVVLAAIVGWVTAGSGAASEPSVRTATFKADVDAFFDREIPAHLALIPAEGPLPERVHGALTTGEFSWGTFVRALAAYAETRQVRTIGDRRIVPLVARVGVIESASGSKAFAQLYAALALRHFGADLERNDLWQSLSADERVAWKSLLDPTRFYDPQTRRVIDLPENYLGVASRVATLAFQMRVLEDRSFVDALLERAAEPFTKGALYADDAGTTGRYDRYSNEYARYVYEAAETIDRQDIMAALQPSLTAQMKLWWDLVSPDGYSYPWGRSLGVVSYLDTLEIVAFLARHPALRPAPLPDLTGQYRKAWLWLRHDYSTDRHMLSVFAPGRGNYAYITKAREWQQTVGFFGKALMAQDTLMRVLRAEKVVSFPAHPSLPPVARFEFFRRGARPAGVWVVRQGALRFALPITTGTKPGVADYLPAPHGLPGFAAPVEEIVPAGASFFELADGTTLAATDGADDIQPGADGRSLRATWRRFGQIGKKSGELVEPGFEVSVEWRIIGSTLSRAETITANQHVTIRRLAFILPSTATDQSQSPAANGAAGVIRLSGPEGVLEARTAGELPIAASVRRMGDAPLGRGARGAIPLHVAFEATNIELRPGRARSWVLSLDASPLRKGTTR